MAQRIIGLDVGSYSIKAMVLHSSLRKVSLAELREHHLPTDALGMPLSGEVAASVKAVLAGLDSDALVAGVPGVQVLLRELELPFSDEKNVSQVLSFRLEGLLPRPVETMVYDWHLLRKGPHGANLLCPAADKQWLDHWLAEIRSGGAEPRQLSLSMLAAENLAEHLDLGADETVALLDLGHRSTQISILRQGKLEGVRALSRGGHQVTLAIARALSLPYHDAERIKHEELRLDGEPVDGVSEVEAARIMRAAGQALEPLLREVKMSLDAMVKRGETLGRVFVIGGTARLPGLDTVLEQMLGVTVERPALKGPIWGDLIEDRRVPEIGLPAVALALEHMADAGGHRVNLRRGDLGGVSDFGAIRAKAGWIAAFLAVLLVLFFVRKVMRVSTLEDHEQQLAERLDDYGDKVLGEKPDGELPVVDRFNAVKDLVLSRPEAETEQIYPQMTAFRIFYEVSRIQKAVNDEGEPPKPGMDEPFEEDEDGLPKPPEPKPVDPATPPPTAAEKHQIELNSFAADVKTGSAAAATISGSGFDIVTIEKFASRLRQHPCFKKVDRQETKKSNNANRLGWTDFTIKVDVKCEAQGEPEAKADSPDKGGDKAKPADKPEGE